MTTGPTLAEAKPTSGTLYSYVQASEELVMDSQFDVVSWFSMEAGDAMAETEMAAIIAGDSVNKPSALLKVAPEAAADGTHGWRFPLPRRRLSFGPRRWPVREAGGHDLSP